MKLFKALTLGACIASTVGQSALAQRESMYATVKGWTVAAFFDGSGALQGCAGVNEENGQRLILLEERGGVWKLGVDTWQTDTFVGGILDIDKVSIDSQFGISDGVASRELSGSELKQLKAGSQVGVLLNGDGAERWWSLAGSTAAILKISECVQRAGQIQTAVRTSPARPATPAMPVQSGSDLLKPIRVGETQVGDCQMGFTDVYRCTFEGQAPKPGFTASIRVTDAFNANTPQLDLDVVSSTEADVWAWMDGTWLFMGRWEHNVTEGRCLIPTSGQSDEAEANLGQDVWMICLR